MKPDVLRIFALLIFLALGGCGSLVDLGQDQVPDNIYNLSPPDQMQAVMAGEEKILLLGQMTYPAYVETEKIAVKPSDHEILFLANSRWSDKASALLTDYLRISLDQEEGWMVIDRKHTALTHDYRLEIDVRDFSMHVGEGSVPEIVFQVAVDLFQTGPLEVIARKGFTARVMARENTKEAIIAAFNEAADEISRKLKVWLTQTVE